MINRRKRLNAFVSMCSRLFGTGNLSMMRVLTFFIVIDVMAVWNIACVKAGTIVEVPTNALGLILAALLGKVGQRFAEKGENKDFSPPIEPEPPKEEPLPSQEA